MRPRVNFLVIVILVCGQTGAQEIQEVLTFPHCPVCCRSGEPGPPGIQGSAGSQGISGAPGVHGLHGEPGAKGEVGFIGFKGRKGERGPTGARGDIGIPTAGGLNVKGDPGQKGVKGELGTRGSEGRSGDQGTQGSKGQKGQKGKKGASAVALIPAFFVKLTTGNVTSEDEFIFLAEPRFEGKRSVKSSEDESATNSRKKRQFVDVGVINPGLINPGFGFGVGFSNVIPFDRVILNEEGGWIEDEHVFVAPIAGTYLFSTTIYKHKLSPYVAAVLYRNQEVLASTEDSGTTSDSATMTAIVEMREGDVSWVQVLSPTSVYGTEAGQTFFTGLLIN